MVNKRKCLSLSTFDIKGKDAAATLFKVANIGLMIRMLF